MSKSAHNVSCTPDQWARIVAAAAEAGARRGFHMSVSEWLRLAAREKMDREFTEELLASPSEEEE